jgi:hypothetical protein
MQTTRSAEKLAFAQPSAGVTAPSSSSIGRALNGRPAVVRQTRLAEALNDRAPVQRMLRASAPSAASPSAAPGARDGQAAAVASSSAADKGAATIATTGPAGPTSAAQALTQGSIILPTSQLRFYASEIGRQWISRERLIPSGQVSLHAICGVGLRRMRKDTNVFSVDIEGFHLTVRTPQDVASIKALSKAAAEAPDAATRQETLNQINPIATRSLHQSPGKAGAAWQHGGKNQQVMNQTLAAMTDGNSKEEFADVMALEVGDAQKALTELLEQIGDLLKNNGMELHAVRSVK